MFVEVAAEISANHSRIRDKLVQINVYDACIEDFKQHGIDVLSLLKMLGFPNCLVMEVPLIHNVGMPVIDIQQFQTAPEVRFSKSNPVTASTTPPTVHEAETKPQAVDVMKEIRKEIIEPMDLEQQGQNLNGSSTSAIHSRNVIFNADVSVVQPVSEIISPGAQSFSDMPTPFRSSTKIDEDKGSIRTAKGSSVFVRNSSRMGEIIAKNINSKEIVTGDNGVIPKTSWEFYSGNLDVKPNSEVCSVNVASRSYGYDNRALTETVPSNINGQTLVIGNVQTCLYSLNDVLPAILSDLGASSNNLTTQTLGEDLINGMTLAAPVQVIPPSPDIPDRNDCHGDSFVRPRSDDDFAFAKRFFSSDVSSLNMDGQLQLREIGTDTLNQNQEKIGNIVNLLDGTGNAAKNVVAENNMETCNSDTSPPVNGSAVVAEKENDIYESQCSYSYPNPTSPAVTNAINSVQREVKQESAEENFEDALEHQINDEDDPCSDSCGPSAPKKSRKKDRTQVFECLYPNCNIRFRRRRYVHLKLMGHLQSHSPFPRYSCLMAGCDSKFMTSQLIIEHYAQEHPTVQFPGMQKIRRKSTKNLPTDIVAALWKQCFPGFVEQHATKGWPAFKRIKEMNANL